MITAIEIENFRGFGKRQRIELSPITLIYGANSAGKTALLHSLLFLHEVFVERNASPDRSILGGRFVNFGSYRELVFGGDASRPIKIRIEMSFDWNDGGLDWGYRYDTGEFTPRKTIDRVGVEIAFKAHRDRFSISGYTFLTEDSPIVKIDFGDTAGVDNSPFGMMNYMGLTEATVTLFGDNCVCPEDSDWSNNPSFQAHCLGSLLDGQGFLSDQSFNHCEAEFGEAAPKFFCGWVRGISHQLIHHLSELTSLGPLREVPVDFVPRLHREKSRVSTGLYAWDELARLSPQPLLPYNKWLGPEGLDLGYRLEFVMFVPFQLEQQLDSNGTQLSPRWDKITEQHSGMVASDFPGQIYIVALREQKGMESNAVWHRPSSVGVGFSQIVPVVYHCLSPKPHRQLAKKLLLIEQPELHLHPRAQTRLGDLFLQSFGRVESNYKGEFISDEQTIIETHSEHMLLRVLRRIRESTNGDLPADFIDVSPEILSVYYFEHSSEGVVATKLRIDETGEFIDRWPAGFFEERGEELF